MKIDCIESVLKDTNTGAVGETGDHNELTHIDKVSQIKVDF